MDLANRERSARGPLSEDQVIRGELMMRLLMYPFLLWAIVDESAWGAVAMVVLVVFMGLLSRIAARRRRYREVVLFAAIATLAVFGHWVAAPHVSMDMRLFR